jgi:hypothetical protein
LPLRGDQETDGITLKKINRNFEGIALTLQITLRTDELCIADFLFFLQIIHLVITSRNFLTQPHSIALNLFIHSVGTRISSRRDNGILPPFSRKGKTPFLHRWMHIVFYYFTNFSSKLTAQGSHKVDASTNHLKKRKKIT